MLTFADVSKQLSRKEIEIISSGRNEVVTSTKTQRNERNPIGKKRPLPKAILRIRCAAATRAPARRRKDKERGGGRKDRKVHRGSGEQILEYGR